MLYTICWKTFHFHYTHIFLWFIFNKSQKWILTNSSKWLFLFTFLLPVLFSLFSYFHVPVWHFYEAMKHRKKINFENPLHCFSSFMLCIEFKKKVCRIFSDGRKVKEKWVSENERKCECWIEEGKSRKLLIWSSFQGHLMPYFPILRA